MRDQELDSGDILRCRQYIYEMEISMNGQGYVIGDPVTGKTVDGAPSLLLCSESRGLSNSFFVSGFFKKSADVIVKDYPGFRIFPKIKWYEERLKHLISIFGDDGSRHIPNHHEMDTGWLRDLDRMYENYSGY